MRQSRKDRLDRIGDELENQRCPGPLVGDAAHGDVDHDAIETAKQLVVHGLLRNAAVDNVDADNARVEKLLLRVRAHELPPATPIPWFPPHAFVCNRPAMAAGMLAMVAVAASLLIVFFSWPEPVANPRTIARLMVHDSGVTLADPQGNLQPSPTVGQSLPLTTGQIVRTSDSLDAADIVYDDGTIIELASDTEVTLSRSAAGSKQLRVAAGLIQADVAPQPGPTPLRITTSTATLEVVGTSLGVDVNEASTKLEVASGLVSMTRRVDGKRVEVASGQLATATSSTKTAFDSQPFPALPDRWSEDFRDGLPNGWSAGELVWTNNGSAVLAAGDDRGVENNIAVTTHNAWREGQHALFSLHNDSVLHIRFRQRRFAPLRLMLVTRTYPPSGKRRGVNVYYEDPSWNANILPGQWHTISVTLADVSYFGKRGDFQTGNLKLEGLATFMIQLTSMNEDVGLTVDRMWATRTTDPDATVDLSHASHEHEKIAN